MPGYRLFVDRLTEVRPMSQPERKAITGFLAGAVDLDDVIDRTVRLLASLTQQVAVVQYPSLTRSTVRHVELVPVGGRRLLVVLIAGTGRVEQRMVDGPEQIDEQTLADVRAKVNAESVGRRLPEASQRLQALPDKFEPGSATWCGPSSGRSTRCSSKSAKSGSCWPAPPTWPGSARTSRAASGRCSTRWKSMWCCCGCSAS
jgi:hypothetical protein